MTPCVYMFKFIFVLLIHICLDRVEASKGKMMEDTGEDMLRAKPSPITTFFKRIGQVSW